MRKVLDGKSVIVGAAAGAAFVAAVGAMQVRPVETGRYQVAAAGSGTGSFRAYVVDTATGQVWSEDPSHTSPAQEFRKPKREVAE